MRATLLPLCLLWLGVAVQGHGHAHSRDEAQERLTEEEESIEELERKWGFEWSFIGGGSFAHLPQLNCLTHPEEKDRFDIGIVGVPFDTAVTYRPGARFGPRAIRAASSRQTSFRGFNTRAGLNPYSSWAKIMDCADMPITPFDNAVALEQMTQGFKTLLKRTPFSASSPSPYFKVPKLITLGGDHSLALAALRTLAEVHDQPIALLHFDSHLDTWRPDSYPFAWPSKQSEFNHGSMFYTASTEGLILNHTSVHAGLRTRLSGASYEDYESDTAQSDFLRISADDIDDIGTAGIIKAINSRMGTEVPVYLSVDIDVLDPGIAPGTGTPEPGGWTTRELIRILRGVKDLNVVGADVVEVAPAYDGVGEQTSLAAAQVVFEILTSMVIRGLGELGRTNEVLEEPGREWVKEAVKKRGNGPERKDEL